MDNDVSRSPASAFRPDRRLTWLTASAAVLGLLVALATDDPRGRLLAVIAVVVLISYVVTDLAFTPRLLVTADGLVVNAPTARVTLPWSQIEDVRADSRSRFGLRSTTLEIDAGPTLVVLSKRALGADPDHVADLVSAFRPDA